MAYDTTDTNWSGTGGTEEEWRKRYPIPGEVKPAGPTGDPYDPNLLQQSGPYNQPGMATGGGYDAGAKQPGMASASMDYMTNAGPYSQTGMATGGGYASDPRAGFVAPEMTAEQKAANNMKGYTPGGADDPYNTSTARVADYYTNAGPYVEQPAAPAGTVPDRAFAPQQDVSKPAAAAPLPAEWLGTPEASDTARPAQYWQRVMAAHGGAMSPEQKAYVEQAIATGLQPGAQFTPPAGTPGTTTPAATPPATTPTTPGAAPGTAPIDQQNQNAQTYSQTPGAAPANNTTNQGTQDVVRNTYLQQLQKGTAVDTNDPNFRMQSDAYAAAQERQRRNALDDAGEAAFAQGASGSGAVNLAKMYADEQAGQNVGAFEADLVGRELTNRRSEIQNALSSLGGMIDNDQKLSLQRELAALDAALKREGLAQTGSLGMADIGLRRDLGTAATNVDLMSVLLNNLQANNRLGFDIGSTEAQNYMRSLGL